jgi:hypothetical protein
MARVIALTATAALAFSDVTFHEPFHTDAGTDHDRDVAW